MPRKSTIAKPGTLVKLTVTGIALRRSRATDAVGINFAAGAVNRCQIVGIALRRLTPGGIPDWRGTLRAVNVGQRKAARRRWSCETDGGWMDRAGQRNPVLRASVMPVVRTIPGDWIVKILSNIASLYSRLSLNSGTNNFCHLCSTKNCSSLARFLH